MTSDERNHRSGRAGLVTAGRIMAALAVLVVLAASCGSSEAASPPSSSEGASGSASPPSSPETAPPGATTSDAELVLALFDAYFGGDVETALSLQAGDLDAAEWASEIRYQALIGATVEVDCDPGAPGQSFSCDILYANDFFAMVDAEPELTTKQFRVRDGVVHVLDPDYPVDGPVMNSIADYLAEQDLSLAYREACAWSEPYVTQPEQCFEFQSEHLDAWAAWYSSAT